MNKNTSCTFVVKNVFTGRPCVFVLSWGGNTFCKKSTFCVLNDPEFLILIQVYFNFNHSCCFNLTKIPLSLPSCRRGRRVEVGWEGERADGSERQGNGKNPRLKWMCFHPFFFASPFFVFSVFTFRYPDGDVDSRSRRVCAMLQLAHRAQTG